MISVKNYGTKDTQDLKKGKLQMAGLQGLSMKSHASHPNLIAQFANCLSAVLI